MTHSGTNSGSVFNEYYELCKPRVVMLIIFTAVIGMFMAVPTPQDLPVVATIFGTLGIGLAAASAAAINQIVEQKFDAEMKRTEGRPLVKGGLSQKQALIFAAVIGIVAMAMLILLVNPLTAGLTFLSLIGYAFVYTIYLKHATPQNIVIGGAAGAAPPVLGWAAVTNDVTVDALILFLIIFVWTPPHFWALAIAKKDDYAKVGIPMLPVTHGLKFTRLQVFLYTVLLLVVTALPFLSKMSGIVYLISATILGGVFLYYAIRIQNPKLENMPMKTFGYSILYLMLLFTSLLIDHYAVNF